MIFKQNAEDLLPMSTPVCPISMTSSQQYMNKFTQDYDVLSKTVGHRQAYQMTWKWLLAARDAAGDFEPARHHRYSQEQIEYHYLKDQSALLKVIEAQKSSDA